MQIYIYMDLTERNIQLPQTYIAKTQKILRKKAGFPARTPGIFSNRWNH